jgi:hypothetical protein
VRPIVRTTRNDPISPGREVDVFLAAAKSRPDEKLDLGGIYADWLGQALAKGGAVLAPKTFRLDAVRRARLSRRGAPNIEGVRPLRRWARRAEAPIW